MKIVQVMASAGNGGLEKHFIELCNGLSQRGHQVYAICLPKYQDQLLEEVCFESMDLKGSRRNPLTLLKLYLILKRIDADIIHAQANKAGQLLAPLVGRLSAKSVVTIHNLKSNLGFVRKFDLCVGVSRAVVDKFPRCNGAVIYNGIHLPAVSGGKPLNLPPLNADRPIALSIGRLVPAKGFDILINACRRVECYVLIAGEGPEKKQLADLIAKHNLQHRIFLLGHRADIPDLVRFSDFVVISSRKEGFSYAFSEALLLSKPVISTDVPIPNEVLSREFISGIDPEDLGRKIKYVMQLGRELETAFKPFFQYALNNLTFERQIENTIEEYLKLQ
jgi:glycosyltransferase involved in cell wall biosynthesis